MANFTNNEKFLLEIIINLPGKPDTDWTQVMTAMGMGSLGGTKNKLRLLEKSYREAKAAQAASNGPTPPNPPSPPKKSSKRQVGDDDSTEGKSKKKTKAATKTSTEA